MNDMDLEDGQENNFSFRSPNKQENQDELHVSVQDVESESEEAVSSMN